MTTDQDPDQTLVMQAQGGDEGALASLLERYRNPVHAFVFRLLGGSAAAEDVAQETFVRAFRALSTFRFRPGARFSTWLFQLARHAALDELRRQRRHPTSSLESLTREPAVSAPDASQNLANRELGEAIARAVATLPEDQRTALILTEYHGQSADEVARVLRCTRRGAEARLFRARQTVRSLLDRKAWM